MIILIIIAVRHIFFLSNASYVNSIYLIIPSSPLISSVSAIVHKVLIKLEFRAEFLKVYSPVLSVH